MTSHLSERDLSAAAAGLELPAGAAAHLGACVACRREAAALDDGAAAVRRRQAEDEPDWEAQRARIVERLGSPVVPLQRRRRPVRMLLAAAAVLVLGFGLGLQLRGPEETLVAGRPVEDVLAEVDATLADDSVPGFEPLAGWVPDADEMATITDGQRRGGQSGGAS